MQTEQFYLFRYVSIIAVVASFFAAVLRFIIGWSDSSGSPITCRVTR